MSEPPARDESVSRHDAWSDLRRYTQARIALGRVGASLKTSAVLDFSLAHARARDAVHAALQTEELRSALERAGFATLLATSQATDRAEYLRRPDLGRRLHPDCVAGLTPGEAVPPHRLTMVIGDGLSALAAARHALPLLLALRPQLDDWALDAVVIATQARVALADPIGELRGAEAAVILLGERPGLSAPDSLGVYLLYAPRPGRTDAERNCISNVRQQGLPYAEAAHKLHYLLAQARLAGRSGLAIKDGSRIPSQLPGTTAQ